MSIPDAHAELMISVIDQLGNLRHPISQPLISPEAIGKSQLQKATNIRQYSLHPLGCTSLRQCHLAYKGLRLLFNV